MNRSTSLRIILSFCLIVTLFFTCITRIFVINSSDYLNASAQNNTYKFTLSRLRRTIFDSNMQPLTNSESKTVAVFTPCESAVLATNNIKNSEDRSRVLNSLKNGEPAFAEVSSPFDAFGVYCTKVYINTPNNLLCPQLIGYLDSDSHGVAGIQKQYDDLLFTEANHSVALATTAKGKVLSGEDIYENFDERVITSGLALTINSDFQALALSAMQNVSSGAAVIAEIGTGKIKIGRAHV